MPVTILVNDISGEYALCRSLQEVLSVLGCNAVLGADDASGSGEPMVKLDVLRAGDGQIRCHIHSATESVDTELPPGDYLNIALSLLQRFGVATDGQPSESQIRSAFLDVCGDDAECTLELTSNILSGNDDDLRALDAAIAELDLTAMAKIVHRLKGVTPLCGADRLAKFCPYMESKLRHHAPTEEILALANWFADAIRQLNRTLQSLTPPARPGE